jgi:DNA-directed RNA polymerase specialized sigma24 family protein
MSHIVRMLNAKKRLPEHLRTLFDLLFVDGLTDAQVCERLRVTPASLRADKAVMIRSLKAASA